MVIRKIEKREPPALAVQPLNAEYPPGETFMQEACLDFSLSMSGHQALYIGLTDSRQFCCLGDFSSGLPDQKGFEEKYGPTLSQEAARLSVIYFGYGTRDPAKPNSLSVQRMFDKYAVKYKSVETPAATYGLIGDST